MTLFALVLALLLASQQWVPAGIRDRRWARRYMVWFERQARNREWPVAAQYAAGVLPIAFACWLLETALPNGLLQAVILVLGVFLLCSVLEFRRLEGRLELLSVHWAREDWIGGFGRSSDGGPRGNPVETVNNSLLDFWVRTNRGLFSPLLWFVLFGPGGIAFYVIGRTAAKNGYRGRGDEPARAWRKVAFEFQQVLDGTSARVMCVGVALLRLNTKALAIAWRSFRATDREAEGVFRMLFRVVFGWGDWPTTPEAIASESVHRARVLVELRNQLVLLWLSLVALLTLAGWLIR
jgi:hypothetical protein